MNSDTFTSFFKNLFNNDFMPHGHCYFWRPDIVWLHVISDGLIALSYFTIPVILLFFMFKRKDFPYPWVLVMFGAFILLCGSTHLMSIITLWYPVYRLDGLILAATAFVSILTTIMLVPIVPLALALKSPKELEEANIKLANANEKLTEIDRLKDNFFSNISHELRTPLTLIIAPLESFLANDYGKLSEIARKNLEAMHNNSVRLFQMINSILDFAKISAKKTELKREPLDLISLTKAIAHEFEPIVKQKKVRISFKPKDSKKIVNMDRYMYERILFNLLSNAAKFTEKGEISISLHFESKKVILKVRDTGIGISNEDQQKLFQRFQQIEGSATRRFEGTGLGLALIKEFSLLLGGDVSVKSTLGKGCTFTVELYATAAALSSKKTVAKPLETRFQQFTINTIEKNTSRELKNAKILIAEDNLELARYISSLISDFAETKHANNGEEAWQLVKTWEPNLVIMDVMMPKRDGISVCHEIKSTTAYSQIPVILLTALTHRDALVRGWEAGADEYLFKPFHPKELTTRIKLLLEHAHTNSLIKDLNRKLIDAARIAGKSEVANNMLHNVGNVLNSINTTTSLLLEKLSDSKIISLKELNEWLTIAFKNPSAFMKDTKKQGELIAYFNQLNKVLLKEQKAYIEDVNDIIKNIKNVNRIIQFQHQMEGPLGVVEEVNIPELLNHSIAISLHDQSEIQVNTQYKSVEKILVDKMRLQEIIVNLLSNAKEALQKSPTIPKELTIALHHKKEQNKKWIEIEISDNGGGIESEAVNSIFNLGYSTKPEGHGFGLHISSLSAKEMGGTLSSKSPGENLGSTFSLKLPIEPPANKNWVKVK